MSLFNSKKKIFDKVNWANFSANDVYFRKSDCTKQFKGEIQLLNYRNITSAISKINRKKAVFIRLGLDPKTFSAIFCKLTNLGTWEKIPVYHYDNEVHFKEFSTNNIKEVQEMLDIIRSVAEFTRKKFAKKW